MKKLAIFLIDFYKVFLSFDQGVLALLLPGGGCKYSPGCSLYTKEQIRKFGLVKGLILGGKRILTCL